MSSTVIRNFESSNYGSVEDDDALPTSPAWSIGFVSIFMGWFALVLIAELVTAQFLALIWYVLPAVPFVVLAVCVGILVRKEIVSGVVHDYTRDGIIALVALCVIVVTKIILLVFLYVIIAAVATRLESSDVLAITLVTVLTLSTAAVSLVVESFLLTGAVVMQNNRSVETCTDGLMHGFVIGFVYRAALGAGGLHPMSLLSTFAYVLGEPVKVSAAQYFGFNTVAAISNVRWALVYGTVVAIAGAAWARSRCDARVLSRGPYVAVALVGGAVLLALSLAFGISTMLPTLLSLVTTSGCSQFGVDKTSIALCIGSHASFIVIDSSAIAIETVAEDVIPETLAAWLALVVHVLFCGLALFFGWRFTRKTCLHPKDAAFQEPEL